MLPYIPSILKGSLWAEWACQKCPVVHLKYRNPGISNIIEIDRSFERVVLPGRTVGVILVPVDTRGVTGVVVGVIVQCTFQSFFPPRGDTAAVAHPILPGLRADERALVFVLCLVVRLQVNCVRA